MNESRLGGERIEPAQAQQSRKKNKGALQGGGSDALRSHSAAGSL